MIIGLTGTLCAGKGTVVEFLKAHGFKHFSVRDFLYEEIDKRGLPRVRDSLVSVANELRASHGPGFLAESLYNRAKEFGGDVIIESIRAPGEIEVLSSKGDFLLLAIDADRALRFKRMISRLSETDHVDFKTFCDQEDKEMHSSDPFKQNLSVCIDKADYLVLNNGSLDELHLQVKEILKVLREKQGQELPYGVNDYVRPSWDEYFLKIMDVVALRATCDRGRSGCVIARDNQILVTGYVGAPRGLFHCDDVGHLLKNVLKDDGTVRQHCVRTVHAEQNAIAQAARLGISIKGSTLYCRMEPCSVCAMLIINCGISRVVCEKRYHAAQETREMFAQAGIELVVVHDEEMKYSK
jgi:dCMP deaminase